jgi:dihydrofolate reductase
MRKLVAGFASSVDGYIEGPDGAYDWILVDKEIDFAATAKRFDTYLLGRKTYEVVLAQGSKGTKGITNYVISTTLQSVDKNFTLISSNVKDEIVAMKAADGRDIAVFGGASLLASLLQLRLVDEITISIIPVLLGAGQPRVALLGDRVWLRLLTSKTYGNGTIGATYEVTYDPPR